MVLLVVGVLAGFVAGRLRSPLGARAVRPRFTRLPLLAVGALGNLAAYLLDEQAGTIVLAFSLVALLAFVGSNLHVTGVAVIGVGLLLNLVALVINNGMPVRPSALVAAGIVAEDELDTVTFSGPRHLEGRGDAFGVLGDVLPLNLPVGREVMSFGDLMVVLGAADAVRDLARRRHPRHQPGDPPVSHLSGTSDGHHSSPVGPSLTKTITA